MSKRTSSKAVDSTIRPPGRVSTRHTHGANEPVVGRYGVERLRHVLGLSGDVDFGRICEDAASEIERLRAKQSPTPWRNGDR